jgi:phenylacetate-coenzyme A ligase PaaK-like adenylate-forming protein
VTGLANRAFPFIRYDLGDQVTFLSPPDQWQTAPVHSAELTSSHNRLDPVAIGRADRKFSPAVAPSRNAKLWDRGASGV